MYSILNTNEVGKNIKLHSFRVQKKKTINFK